MKPVIGITCNYMNHGEFAIPEGIGGETQHWQLLANDYIAAVEAAGGIPVILPIQEDYDNVIELLDKLDGIIISGGNDINPICYGEMPSTKLGRITPNRDYMEIQIAHHVINNTDLPLLGICRGVQVMNVAMGGTLHQDHLEDGLAHHSLGNIPIDEVSHVVKVQPDSLLYKIVQTEELATNSLHHQSVKAVGSALRVVAETEDGTVEALEVPERRAFTLGVQWHPEMLHINYAAHLQIFVEFMRACSEK